MDIFSKYKYLLRITWVLVVVNLCCMAYIGWMTRSRKPQGRNMEAVQKTLRKRLNLSPEQEAEFVRIRESFFEKEAVLSTQIKAQRDSMNMEMFNEHTDTVLLEALARRIAANEYQMEKYRMEQGTQLKKICTPEQLKAFEGLVKEIRDYLKPVKK